MLLVDSSVWILAERQKISLLQLLPGNEVIATCPVIVQEVLSGTRNTAHYQLARRVLLDAEMLDAATPFERFESAARVFLACRDKGITPRSSVDCLIAATALAHSVPLLHDDSDFEQMKRVLPLRTIRPTRSSI